MKPILVPSLFKDSFFNEFDTLFNTVFNSIQSESQSALIDVYGTYPKVDIISFKNKLKLILDIAGLRKSDITIETKDNILAITGSPSPDAVHGNDAGEYIFRERKTSKFKRQFKLSNKSDLSKTSASFDNGILTIEIPFIEEDKQVITNRIEIK